MSAVTLGLATSFRSIAPRAARNQAVIRRSVQHQSLSPAKQTEILNKQRLQRPSSPWWIYQPQLTSVASIFNRVTGCALSVLLYGFSLAYLVAPTTFSSENVVATVAALPVGVKYAGKTILAVPFTFHSWNGVRHLAWDTGKLLNVKKVYSSGYTVMAATAASTAALVAYY